jgi:hypothetical protein
MAITAQQPEIFLPIISWISVYVVHFKWYRLFLPFYKFTALTPSTTFTYKSFLATLICSSAREFNPVFFLPRLPGMVRRV